MPTSTRARRLGVLATSAVLATSTLLTAAPATAATTPSADRARTWLAGELEDGLLYRPVYDPEVPPTPDIGLSIDAALLAEATGDDETAAVIRDAIAPRVVGYITDADFGDPDAFYANETAKVLAMVERTGGDATSYGGVDLVARLTSLTAPNGRIESVGEYTTKANLIGQSFAVEGLRLAGADLAPAAATYVAGLACPNGSFSLTMPTGTAAPACKPDDTSIDASAFAVSALSGSTAPAAVAATDRGAAWLVSQAASDGSFGSDAFIPDANANSTGLAGAALGSACRVDAANLTATWLRGVQLSSGVEDGVEDGAVAYDAAAYADASANGIEDYLRDQFRRSTAQAALGLIWDPAAPTALRLSANDGVLTVTGAAAGETVCLTTPSGTRRLTGTDAPLTVAIEPATGPVTYRATSGPGLATLTVGTATPSPTPTPVPTPATPTVPAPTKPAPGKPTVRFGGKRLVVGEMHRVRVSGLRAGEKVVVKLRHRKVSSRRAGALGNLTLRFRVRTSTGPARMQVLTRGTGTKRGHTVRVVR